MADYIDREATRVYCKGCKYNNGKSCKILGAPIVVGGWCHGHDYEWSEEEQAYIEQGYMDTQVGLPDLYMN